LTSPVRILSGTLMLGSGPVFDTITRVVAVLPGSTVIVKASSLHFDWWPGGGELEIEGIGPMTNILVDSSGKPLPSP
jgi:hypothetical protein